MEAEQKELYFYTKDHFADKLNRIKPECVSPIIAVRQTVRTAIYKYVADYCNKDTDPIEVFSNDDFRAVSDAIYNEIMEGKSF